MQPNVKVAATGAGLNGLKAALAKLERAQVYVGVPEDHTGRNAGTVTNAALVYLHTHGSPLHGLPARPIIEPALQAPDNRALITAELGEAAKAVFSGNVSAVRAHLGRAGMLGRNAAVRWFTDARNGWAPNRPPTVRRKGSSRPLIDTGQMRRSITYFVDE